MLKVFISYSHKDDQFVDLLYKDLISNNIETWIDRAEIKVGDDIPSRLSEGISESNFILVIFSNNYLLSEWCKKEISGAITKEVELGTKVILPVKLEPCEIPSILRGKKYADFIGYTEDPKKYGVAFKELLISINPEIDSPTRKENIMQDEGKNLNIKSLVESGYLEMEAFNKNSMMNVDNVITRTRLNIESEWIREYRANKTDLSQQMYLFDKLRKLLEPWIGYGCFFISKKDKEDLQKCYDLFHFLKELPQKSQMDGPFYREILYQPWDGLMLAFYGWSSYCYIMSEFKTMRSIFDEKIVISDAGPKGISYPLIADTSTRHMQAFGTKATDSFDFIVKWVQDDSFFLKSYSEPAEVIDVLINVNFLGGLYFSMLHLTDKLPKDINSWYYPNFRRYYERRYSALLRDMFHQTRKGRDILENLFSMDYSAFKSLWPACAQYLNGMNLGTFSSHELDVNFFES